jgi:predicted deacylase
MPPDMAVVVIHTVNPWGMAWWRRQNESNVDLNRNWRRDDIEPIQNDPYDQIHPLACPDTDDLPQLDELFAAAGDLVAEKGFEWVRDGITTGQYRHADGLHYGGERTEESNRIVEAIVTERLTGAERVLVLDLHTGHGPRGEITLLSDEPPGSEQDRFFTTHFPQARVEATADNPDATTGVKSGQIGNGIRDLLTDAQCYSTSLEWGTAGDMDQLVATYQEQWVYRRGDRTTPAHAAAVWAYRDCFCPDDEEWERTAMAAGRIQMDAAVAAVASWDA